MLLNAVLADWQRIDVFIVSDHHGSALAQNKVKVLIDRNRIFDTLPDSLHGTQPVTELSDGQLQYQLEEFVRILGLLPLAIGREEHVNGVTGVILLRDFLIKLFIEETGVADKGGNLHLNRLITEEQKMILQSLPALIPTREAVIRANLAYAAVYLPRARKMAEKRNIPWPERFEDVTWQNLKRQLGIDKDNLRAWL